MSGSMNDEVVIKLCENKTNYRNADCKNSFRQLGCPNNQMTAVIEFYREA